MYLDVTHVGTVLLCFIFYDFLRVHIIFVIYLHSIFVLHVLQHLNEKVTLQLERCLLHNLNKYQL